MTAPTRPVLRWHGGKWMLAPWIISHFPPHRIYTEVFGGAASVLLRKERAYAEVYNDLDDELVLLFRVLRDPQQAAALRDALRMTPFARAEFDAAYEAATAPLEICRRMIVRSMMGFGSNGTVCRQVGFCANTQRRGTTPALDFSRYPDAMAQIIDRLAGVVIENRDAAKVLLAHDGAETLHYVDPPYVHSTREGRRTGGEAYRHEMTDDDHRALADVLHSLKGMVVLSGYPSDLYDKDLYPAWRRIERAALADGARPRTEVLWLNPVCSEVLSASQAQYDLMETARG